VLLQQLLEFFLLIVMLIAVLLPQVVYVFFGLLQFL